MLELNTLHKGIDYSQYASQSNGRRALRSSMLSTLHFETARHLQHKLAHPKEETEALRQGKLIHSLFENPEKFMDCYKVEPIFEGRTKKGELTTSANCAEVKEAKAKWYAQLETDAIVCTQEDVDMLTGIWKSLQQKKHIQWLLKGSVNETSGWTTDPETGITLAWRPDRISEKGFVIDLKSTTSANERHFLPEIWSDKGHSRFYCLSAAHYAHCMKVSKLGLGDHYFFLAIEKTAPFEMNAYPLDAGCLDWAEHYRKKHTRTYADCLMSDTWPGYPDESVIVLPPEWDPE